MPERKRPLWNDSGPVNECQGDRQGRPYYTRYTRRTNATGIVV
nr:hypothetical protein [Ktedonobacteraceae bacterium]